uniref:Uncharacterized protein n=1 Tax=Anopheles albimanus TaxID=7167 RepID=A0A182FWU9_ANOAL
MAEHFHVAGSRCGLLKWAEENQEAKRSVTNTKCWLGRNSDHLRRGENFSFPSSSERPASFWDVMRPLGNDSVPFAKNQ